jgi:hypothetical protein
MKRFDPIYHHQNGPGWSFDYSAIKECEDGDYVRFEDCEAEKSVLLDALRACYNFAPCNQGMQAGIREQVRKAIGGNESNPTP